MTYHSNLGVSSKGRSIQSTNGHDYQALLISTSNKKYMYKGEDRDTAKDIVTAGGCHECVFINKTRLENK